MNHHERRYATLKARIDKRLHGLIRERTPKEVNEACRYVLRARGKRIRAALVLLSCEAVGGKANAALNASVAVEIMHNFTLVHDDIMDNASTRRGRPTVHTQWNINYALLAGDILLGVAYREILRTQTPLLREILRVFTRGLLEVCEGQALDLEFETRINVTLPDYFAMIEKKTGRLLSTATSIGGLIGGGTARHVAALQSFGLYLGRAFQVQDDLLDVLADEKDFGKTIGGDIIEGKKTFLLLKALESARGAERAVLVNVMKRKHYGRPRSTTAEVHRVTEIYRTTGAIAAARACIQRDTTRAERALAILPDTHARASLLWLSQMLLDRRI